MSASRPVRTQAATPPSGRAAAWARALRPAAWAPYAGALLTLVVIWQIAAFFLPSFLMPDVPIVLQRFGRELADPAFFQSLGRSLIRLAAGYAFAVAFGIVLGLIGGLSSVFRLYLRALVTMLQSIPSIAWVPLFVILMGFGDRPIIVVIAIAGFFPMALSVMNATESVERVHLQVAQVLGANRRQLLQKVYAPEVAPAIITGAQVAFGNAWRALVAAEMIGGVNVGLGWSIAYAGEIADMPGVLLGILVIGVLAAAIDRFVLEGIKRRLLRWRYV